MVRTRTVIIGASGALGRELAQACDRRGESIRMLAGRKALDITDADAVQDVLGGESASVVINAAAYNDVDGAEGEQELADLVNRGGPANLAEACRATGAVLVHFSTDYVFDGRAATPYRVTDEPHPINVYGATKLAGERAIVGGGCEHLIVRTSWLFAAHGSNFVRTIHQRLEEGVDVTVVDDQYGRPTYAPDLAAVTLRLLDRGARGVFHAANEGRCTWYELAAAVSELEGRGRVRPCRTAEYPRAARRPAYSVLDLSATAALAGAPRHWHEALAECVGRLAAPAGGRAEVTGTREPGS